MTRYAVGDIQGCLDNLRCVLDQVKFDPVVDQLWIAGDLVNRGPDSLGTLRFVKSLGSAAACVLGNHDLHLLAIAAGGQKVKRKDTLQPILDAPDAAELLVWLQQQPLMLWDRERNQAMTHAGIPHIWSLEQAWQLAGEVQQVLRSDKAGDFFQAMYGNLPACWDENLQGQDRLRVITNYFTRMRFVDRAGCLDLECKQGPNDAPAGFAPWFQYNRQEATQLFFGHWAALEGRFGLLPFIGLDTGCIWGGPLTLLVMDDLANKPWTLVQCPSGDASCRFCGH